MLGNLAGEPCIVHPQLRTEAAVLPGAEDAYTGDDAASLLHRERRTHVVALNNASQSRDLGISGPGPETKAEQVPVTEAVPRARRRTCSFGAGCCCLRILEMSFFLLLCWLAAGLGIPVVRMTCVITGG